MLKHMLTPKPSNSHTRPKINQKLHSEDNGVQNMEELSMLDEPTSTIRPNGLTRNHLGQISSSVHANLSQNQSIYANTVALPKMNGAVTTGRGAIIGPTGQGNNGLNSSKLSSSTSPGTNQTKTSIMESSRDQSLHDLESTQLSPIGRSASLRTPAITPSGPQIAAALHHHQGLQNAYKTQDRSHITQNGGIRHNSTAMSNGGLNITNLAGKKLTATLPANVTKFMNMSKEAGVKGMITSLGLLCLVSLLLALLSLVFLLKISPSNDDKSGHKYQFEFLSATEYVVLYEVTLALCAITLSLNLCCLLVCAIQFLFAVKLIKSSHGRIRTNKYLREASGTRICAIGGFFVSIPVFLAGIVLYTFLHFDSTPAIVTSVVVGIGIVFCGAAVVHNVFVWQKEKLATIRGDHVALSPVLARRDLIANELDKSGKNQGTFAGVVPQATLDLSGPANASNNSRGALELSTLV